MAMAFPFTRLTAINFNLKTITDRENLLGILPDAFITINSKKITVIKIR
jgi:hypothetical protein